MNKFNLNKNTNGGQIAILSLLLFISISSIFLASMTIPVAKQTKNARDILYSKQSFIASESVNDEVFYRLNKNLEVPSSVVLSFSNGVEASAVITDLPDGTKQIVSDGNSGDFKRKSEANFSQGVGVSFNYGVQVGTGGILITSGTINGSVYSNGSITMSGSPAIITGSATAANAIDPIADQVNSTTTPNVIEFGKQYNTVQDLAQSFQVSTSTSVSSISLTLKKVGTPSNLTIRVTSDNAGNPSKTSLATATLSSSLVTTATSTFMINFSPTLNLTAGTTYWLVLDGSTALASYYHASASEGLYANGVAKIGQWSSGNGGTWSSVSSAGSDIVFSIYLGGNASKIEGLGSSNRIRVGTGTVGIAWANQINYVSIGEKLYCKGGTANYYISSGLPALCDTSRADPTQVPFPISDANIEDWKTSIDEALITSGGWTYSGNLTINYLGTTTTSLSRVNGNLTLSCSQGPATFGNIEVTGNVTVGSGCHFSAEDIKVGGNFSMNSGQTVVKRIKTGGTFSISGGSVFYFYEPIWSVGNLSVTGGAVFALHPSLGSTDGLIISDGTMTVSGGSDLESSGDLDSYILFVSTSDCPGNCGGASQAVSVSGGSGAVAIFAPYGTINVSGGSNLKQATGERLLISGGSELNYENGLSNLDFEGGPSGAWTVDSWEETAE